MRSSSKIFLIAGSLFALVGFLFVIIFFVITANLDEVMRPACGRRSVNRESPAFRRGECQDEAIVVNLKEKRSSLRYGNRSTPLSHTSPLCTVFQAYFSSYACVSWPCEWV